MFEAVFSWLQAQGRVLTILRQRARERIDSVGIPKVNLKSNILSPSLQEARVMIYTFLSHDVDWGRSGAPVSHIMARKDRFEAAVLKNCETQNPYYNLPEYMEIEEKYGVRSTFFFRTYVPNAPHPPPAYDVSEYQQDIRFLVEGGWEIGLHMDPTSHKSLELIRKEKETLETVAKTPVVGNRVHYTMNNDALHRNLTEAGFKYDSSAKFSREKIVEEDFGYFKKNGLIVFPMTIMDALAFNYLVPTEDDVVNLLENTVEMCRKIPRKDKIITIVWHDCVLKMKKGRRYQQVLEYLTSIDDVEVKRGVDLLQMIDRGML